MVLIPITGKPSTDRVPGGFAEILFAQGPASAAADVREVVLAMPMLATGAWTAATLYAVPNEQAAIDGAGVGSPLHRAARKFLASNKVTKLWALPVAETTGGTPAAADFDVTWTTDPTSDGETTVRVCDQDFTYSFVAGTDTITTIAAAVSALINNAVHLPVTAANVAGVMTVTARLKGTSQGDGTVGVIQVRPEVDAGVGTTVSAAGEVGDTVPGAEGSTTEAASLATSLATIDSKRIYYVCTSSPDATSIDNMNTHVTNKSTPSPGLRSVGICAYPHTLAAATTIANGDNYERCQMVWQTNSDHDCAELAAAMAAVRAKHENTSPNYNFAGYRATDWRVNAAPVVGDWPSHANLVDAINDGITAISSDDAGSKIVMSVNTRSKDTSGTYDDFRACETHRVSVADACTDEVLTEWALNYQGMMLASDTLLADGTADPNQKNIRNVLRPSMLASWLKSKLTGWEDKAWIQDAAASKESLRVVRCDTNSARVESSLDLHVIDHAHQLTVRVNEVSNA